MKPRLDLQAQLTVEDILEEALANNHRYMARPLFSKTGTPSLLPDSAEEGMQEGAGTSALIQRLAEWAN